MDIQCPWPLRSKVHKATQKAKIFREVIFTGWIEIFKKVLAFLNKNCSLKMTVQAPFSKQENVLGFIKIAQCKAKTFDAVHSNSCYSTDCMWYSANVTLHVKFNAVIWRYRKYPSFLPKWPCSGALVPLKKFFNSFTRMKIRFSVLKLGPLPIFSKYLRQ